MKNRVLPSTLVLGLILALVAGLSVQLPQKAAHAQDPERDAAPQQVSAPQAPLGTAFTYQGWLTDGGSPAEGEYDFHFSLHDDPTADSPVAGPVAIEDHHVEQGLFTVRLDFGEAFTGTARFLEIGVRPGDSGGAFTTLSPRQELTPAPYALYAPTAPWSGLAGVPAGFADGVDDDTTSFWSLTGNAGTTPGTHFLGTTERVNLVLAVSGTAALRLEPNPISPNLIGGHSSNTVEPAVAGATIGGGGLDDFPNRVTAYAAWATIGGGAGNTIENGPMYSTIGGGAFNSIGDFSSGATIGGGAANVIENGAVFATIGGGSGITVTAQYATVGGGYDNNVGTGSYSATISGGWENDIGDNSGSATIGGGAANDIGDGSGSATIGGGAANDIGDNSGSATIGGGYDNNIGTGNYSATISGGWENDIGDNSRSATIGGGAANDIGLDGDYSTIGGGLWNVVRDDGDYATIGGGRSNSIGMSSDYATIGGGINNDIGDGSGFATIGGGRTNEIADATEYATIPGGRENEANGDYSFAAGLRAKANNQGCFVWVDSRGNSEACNDDNRTIFRSTGGFYIYTNLFNPRSGLHLAAGGSSWNSHSDQKLKENFQPVNTQQLLARLAEHPITTWNYKSQDPAIRHIGPMAQDFNALIPGLGGEGKTHINTLDADGVALAAIQGLYAQNQGLAAENSALVAENATQQEQIDDLEARLTALERGGVSPTSVSALPSWLLLGGLVLTGAVVVQRRRVGGER
jgi:hypothetical protein